MTTYTIPRQRSSGSANTQGRESSWSHIDVTAEHDSVQLTVRSAGSSADGEEPGGDSTSSRKESTLFVRLLPLLMVTVVFTLCTWRIVHFAKQHARNKNNNLPLPPGKCVPLVIETRTENFGEFGQKVSDTFYKFVPKDEDQVFCKLYVDGNLLMKLDHTTVASTHCFLEHLASNTVITFVKINRNNEKSIIMFTRRRGTRNEFQIVNGNYLAFVTSLLAF